jgi:hypothetical protein
MPRFDLVPLPAFAILATGPVKHFPRGDP